MLGLAVLACAASGTALVLGLKRASDQIARADAERDRAAAIAQRDQAVSDLEEARAGAAATLATLRAEIEGMERDLEACADPDARRARWGRLLATAADPLPSVPERGSAAGPSAELVRERDLIEGPAPAADGRADRSLL